MEPETGSILDVLLWQRSACSASWREACEALRIETLEKGPENEWRWCCFRVECRWLHNRVIIWFGDIYLFIIHIVFRRGETLVGWFQLLTSRNRVRLSWRGGWVFGWRVSSGGECMETRGK